MTQASFEVTRFSTGFRISDRTLGRLVLTLLVVSQVAWIGFLGLAAWHMLSS